MGDAISHAVLPGVAVSFIFQISFFPGALVAGLLTAGAIGYVNQKSRIKSDAAIGIVFTTMFALGIVLISLAPSSTDLTKILFGNLLAVRPSDMWITIGVGDAVLTVVFLFFKELQASSFDPTCAAAYGLSTAGLHYLLMALLTLVTVASLQTVGIILVVAMLVIPASTAYLLTERLTTMTLLSAALGALASVVGMALVTRSTFPRAPQSCWPAPCCSHSRSSSPRATAWWGAPATASRKKASSMFSKFLPLSAVVALAVSACGTSAVGGEAEIEDGVAIVATFSVVADIAANIAGSDASVHSIVPLGVDPHEYTPLAADIEKTTTADIVFFNGLNMEVGDG